MNASELARLMLYWEDQKRGLARTEERIEEAVLELGKTVDTGRVRASYSGGRKKYAYQDAAGAHPKITDEAIDLFKTVVPETTKVDWAGLCAHFGITAECIPFTQSEPRVTIKLTG